MPDGLDYVSVALTSVNYVEPAPNASKHIVYSQLFDELKTTFKKKHIQFLHNDTHNRLT